MILLIDLDKTFLVEFDASVFQAQVVEHRTSTGSVEHAVRLKLTTILEGCFQAAIGLFVDALDVGIELQIHATLGQLFLQMITYRTVEAAQEQITAIQQRGLGT
ncbi:hypothetical protein D3C72_2245840 [compost metagenome]